jgi:hypothetical protein
MGSSAAAEDISALHWSTDALIAAFRSAISWRIVCPAHPASTESLL